LKKYKAIFFDWDGTAVLSRKAPVDKAVEAMRPLLDAGIKLAVISGTTMENIAGGEIERYFTEKQLSNLYLGLGRGAYNYTFEGGSPCIFESVIPSKELALDIHRIFFDIHMELKEKYDYDTDIVFSRPNYCKIDLMVSNARGDQLFMQENELDNLKRELELHGISGGMNRLIELAKSIGRKYQIDVVPTCDAKYLEVGISSKSDNVDTILAKLLKESDIRANECSYWGDEYVGLEKGIYGSDSFMFTRATADGDFFDVSDVAGERPEGVKVLGGGVKTFLDFLLTQGS